MEKTFKIEPHKLGIKISHPDHLTKSIIQEHSVTYAYIKHLEHQIKELTKQPPKITKLSDFKL